MGEAGEGKNITHQQKKLNEEELRAFRDRFGIPISDDEDRRAPVLPPADDSAEMKYLQRAPQGARRLRAARKRRVEPLARPALDRLRGVLKGTEGRKARRRWRSCGCCRSCCATRRSASCRADRPRRGAHLRHGRRCSARSASTRTSGQLYEPVDMRHAAVLQGSEGRPDPRGGHQRGRRDVVVHRRRHVAYATHGVNMIPFFIYYSMFGFQRVGDLIWAAATCARAASCSAAPPAARRSAAKACSTRTATATCCARGPELRLLRPGVRLRARGDHPGRHPPHVREQETSSTTSR
jgi:pyruvate dehydrogenase E1 component